MNKNGPDIISLSSSTQNKIVSWNYLMNYVYENVLVIINVHPYSALDSQEQIN